MRTGCNSAAGLSDSWATACCCCVRFFPFVPSLEIGLGKRLRNGPFCCVRFSFFSAPSQEIGSGNVSEMTCFVVLRLVFSTPSQEIGLQKRPEMTYFVALGLVSSAPSQQIGSGKRLRNDPFFCRVGRKSPRLNRSISDSWVCPTTIVQPTIGARKPTNGSTGGATGHSPSPEH